jgi:hypothetical integral membrane protein (TIGR02206 family)
MDFFNRIPINGADEYHLFTLTYFVALIVALILLWVAYSLLPKLKNFKYEKYIRYIIALYLLYTTINIDTFFWQNNLPWYAYIPEGTCGFGVLLAIYVLITKNRKAFVLLFFWGWGAFLALFAPNIKEGPNYYFFYQFYLRHMLLLISAFYMMRVFDYKIFKSDYWIYVYVTLPLSLFALGVRYAVGDNAYGNIFFMMRPAISNTPLDFFYQIHPLFYTFIWVIIAFIFGYLYGLPAYQDNILNESRSTLERNRAS